MPVKILESKENYIKFEVTNTKPYIINTLRRNALSKVIVFAMDYIDVLKNQSALYNEILAHRLAMVPFTLGDGKYVRKDECKCKGEGCSNCEVKVVLKKKGPGYVYTGDIKSTDPKVVPVYKNIPITYLSEGHSIDVEGTLTLGSMREHAKFQPVVFGYQYKNNINIKPKKAKKEELIAVCPKKAINKDMSVDAEKCDLCGICAEKYPDDVDFSFDETDIIVKVESVSGMQPKDVILKSIEVAEKELDAFEKALK